MQLRRPSGWFRCIGTISPEFCWPKSLLNDTVKNWRAWIFWLCLSAGVAASRLSHVYLLWTDEDYHLAAAIQVLAGKFPYRDFWYDKPPLNLSFYLAFGAWPGIPLRLADTVFVCASCALAYLL